MSEFRLPVNVQPLHYDIVIRTDLRALTCHGVVTIDLDVLQDTSSIILNAVDLEFTNSELTCAALSADQAHTSLVISKETNRLTVDSHGILPAGSKAQLTLVYLKKLTETMTGYYYATGEGSDKQNYALTQFEPTGARRAFPCWDEPLVKATFALTMISRRDTVNLNNMPEVWERIYTSGGMPVADGDDLRPLFKTLGMDGSQDANEQWKVTKFDATPRMSTYIVAWANGHWSYLESSYTSPISGKVKPLRTYASLSVVHLTKHILDTTARVMPIYEQFFDIEYPLPKLDTLTVASFDPGAMENWGLIVGGALWYLYDAETSDLASKQLAAAFQSHECSHMWFGNIVTMEWWDNLWLNEGFATLMGEIIAISRLYPEWKANSMFITTHMSSALTLDAKRSSHPIEVPIENATNVTQIFDQLSYAKAASIIRMLLEFVGEDKFFEGVSVYLKRHLYQNSVTKNLWEGIEQVSGIDVPSMMNNWVTKIGFPVLTVTEATNKIIVRQSRFLVTGDATEEENQTLWHIPLRILQAGSSGAYTVDRSAVLTTREASFDVNTTQHYKLNAGTSGFYRVAYPPARWVQLGEEAARPGSLFSVEDRMGLVTDAFVLAQAGVTNTSNALTFVARLRDEPDHLVWSAIANQVNILLSVYWEQGDVYQGLLAFKQSLWSPLVRKLGYLFSSDDDIDATRLRTLAIENAVNAEDPNTIAELQLSYKRFQETNDASHIPPDLLSATFAAAVKRGGREEWEFATNQYLASLAGGSSTQKLSAVQAICATRDPELIQETFKFLEEKVPTSEYQAFLGGLADNFHARRLLWRYFKENYASIYGKFYGTYTWNFLVEAVITKLTSEEDLHDVQQFFEDKDISSFKLVISQCEDSIKSAIRWIKADLEDVRAWLKDWKAT